MLNPSELLLFNPHSRHLYCRGRAVRKDKGVARGSVQHVTAPSRKANVITKQILDEKSGLAASQPTIEVVLSLPFKNAHLKTNPEARGSGLAGKVNKERCHDCHFLQRHHQSRSANATASVRRFLRYNQKLWMAV